MHGSPIVEQNNTDFPYFCIKIENVHITTLSYTFNSYSVAGVMVSSSKRVYNCRSLLTLWFVGGLLGALFNHLNGKLTVFRRK